MVWARPNNDRHLTAQTNVEVDTARKEGRDYQMDERNSGDATAKTEAERGLQGREEWHLEIGRRQ